MSRRTTVVLGAVLLAWGAATWNGAAAAAPAPGSRAWVAPYGDPVAYDEPTAVAASPDGTRVFTTGYRDPAYGQPEPGSDGARYATVANDAATGARLWEATYTSGPSPSTVEFATALAVSPDGTKVFVTGSSTTGSYATVAYAAATGAQLWVTSHAGDSAVDIAVSPDGTKVFTAGSGTGVAGKDIATVAYSAATGAELWVAVYNGPANRDDKALALAVSPNGTRVAVTGTSNSTQRGDEYLTNVYRTSDGARSWFARYNHVIANRFDYPVDVAFTPGGGSLFVTGVSQDSDHRYQMATIAYSTATGAQLWVSRLDGPDRSSLEDMVVSPSGTRIYLAGSGSFAPFGAFDYYTVALDAATGAEMWSAGYDGPGYDGQVFAGAVSEDGTKLIVTGSSRRGETYYGNEDWATVAYDAATGAQLWDARVNASFYGDDAARDVVVLPGRNQVAVTGYITTATSIDMATIAYRL